MLFRVKPIPRQFCINGRLAECDFNFLGWYNVLFFLNFSILLKDSPIQALFSACALGILHHDNQLSETILTELKKRENSEKHVADIAYLTAQYYLVNVSFE